MRRGLFILLLAGGFVSVVVGIAVAFVSPRLSYPSSHSIPCSGFVEYHGEEILVDEGLRAAYVDARGYVPIFVGAGLLSVAFIGRLRKNN